MTNSEPKENTFTDDDLRALKQNASDPALKHLCDVLSKGMVLAILARLEAAEGPFTSNHEEGSAAWWLDYEEAKRAWRKAAGK